MGRRYMPGYLFVKLASQTRMKKQAVTAARMVLVRQISVSQVTKTLGVKQPLVSRAVSRIILEAQKEHLRKTITADIFPREKPREGLPSPLAQYETTFEDVLLGMGEDAYLKFILDIKLKEKTRDGSALGLLRFTPVLTGESLPTQKFLLNESEAVVREVMREKDHLVQIGNDFFVIAENVTRIISEMIVARYRDRFQKKLNLKIDIGLSIYDLTTAGLSAEKMVAQAKAR